MRWRDAPPKHLVVAERLKIWDLKKAERFVALSLMAVARTAFQSLAILVTLFLACLKVEILWRRLLRHVKLRHQHLLLVQVALI